MPLVIPAGVECNTSQDKILANVLQNSRRPNKWLGRSPAHGRTAILCGSGPSISDCVRQIRKLRRNPHADIFALNNAARWLYDEGFMIDYQVIMDAQPRTADLIGAAETYLFASMVDPSLFDAVPEAILWHSTHGDLMVDEQEGFPKRNEDYCLIGSGITVGNTSLPLLYAMGYRDIHIFGMDSCHRGKHAHVVHQSINDGDPCTVVEFMGREYICSFTMKLQADNFMQRATALKDGGCKIQMHGEGYLQALWRATQGPLDEKTKYEIMWSMPEYRECGSPGEVSAADFVRIARPKLGEVVLDLGCGPGRGGQAIKKLCGCDIVYVDIAKNCAAPQPFIECDMSAQELPKGDFGYSADVLEHIPPEHMDMVLSNIARAAPYSFHRISLLDDVKGILIGHKLHLSVHDAKWWMEKLSLFGKVLFFHDFDTVAYFYVKSFDYSEK